MDGFFGRGRGLPTKCVNVVLEPQILDKRDGAGNADNNFDPLPNSNLGYSPGISEASRNNSAPVWVQLNTRIRKATTLRIPGEENIFRKDADAHSYASTGEISNQFKDGKELPSDLASGRRINLNLCADYCDYGPTTSEKTSKHPQKSQTDPGNRGVFDNVPLGYSGNKDQPLLTKGIHPSVQFKVEEWTQWHTLGCNDDFIDYPPVLQFEKKFPPLVNTWTFMKCIICKCVCPPPPYSCENGHLLCFSCCSVQNGSSCPIMISFTGITETAPCGKFLEPLRNLKFEEYFPEPRDKYPCPFQKFGCQESNTLFPDEVVEHAQKCLFRYAVKCFISGCDRQKEQIRIGNFVEHIVDSHGGRIIELENFENNQPLPIYFDSSSLKIDDTWMPILFIDKKKEYMFPLIVKKTIEFVYFWIYKIAEQNAKGEKFKGRILLHSRFTNSEDLIANDTIHDAIVSNEDVMKSGRVLKVNTKDFENNFLCNYEPSECLTDFGAEKREQNSYVYILYISISKVKRGSRSNKVNNVQVDRPTVKANNVGIESNDRENQQVRTVATTTASSFPYKVDNLDLGLRNRQLTLRRQTGQWKRKESKK